MRAKAFLLVFIASVLVSLSPATVSARAGGDDRQAYHDDAQYEDERSFRCESDSQRTVYCRVESGQDVRFVRQHSRAACVEGRTWGWDRGGVWVSGGCRAEFELADRRGGWGNGWGSGWGSGWGNDRYDDRYDDRGYAGDGLVRCESKDSRVVVCRAQTYRGVRLANQLSRAPCIQGQSWGHDDRGIWVSEGCRAEFLLAGDDRGGWQGGGHGGQRGNITCESEDGRYVFCRASRVRQARLQRQLSRGACVEGQSWGYRNDGIWVNNGCRGEFAVY